MRLAALFIVFVLGAAADVVIAGLLPSGWVEGFQQGVREAVGGAPAGPGGASPAATMFPTASRGGFRGATATAIARAGATPIATAGATFTPRPSPTSTPVSRLSSAELDELRYHALRLINNDRADHGLPPVVLGVNPAAQLHAEDMLVHDYFGHWWADGRKPYMVYTQTGGTSYVSENAATSGWTDREWRSKNCGSFTVRCSTEDPEGAITELQWLMMYDDAHADWGHRDNILGETHRSVNIGVAFNGRRTTFAQHFEGGAARADGPPELDEGGMLSFSLSKVETGIAVGEVASISYDPPPTSKTPAQIGSLGSYCVGGGFTANCPDSYAARILEPPGADYYYTDLSWNEVVADSWREDSGSFSFRADVGGLLDEPGVYTLVVWRDTGGEWLSEELVELSLFVGVGFDDEQLP